MVAPPKFMAPLVPLRTSMPVSPTPPPLRVVVPLKVTGTVGIRNLDAVTPGRIHSSIIIERDKTCVGEAGDTN